MKLSIIIPVYNVEKYIQRCLESVMSQETDSFETECIIVDDCTPDSSMDIIRKMVNDYQGSISFIFLNHQQNKGLSEARNTLPITISAFGYFFLAFIMYDKLFGIR